MGIPTKISRDDLCDGLRAFGLDPGTVYAVEVGRHGLVATLWREDEDGHRYIGPNNEPAKQVVDIPIDDLHARWGADR